MICQNMDFRLMYRLICNNVRVWQRWNGLGSADGNQCRNCWVKEAQNGCFIVTSCLRNIHWGLKTHIFVSEMSYHLFKYSPFRHYLNVCRLIINWAFKNKLRLKLAKWQSTLPVTTNHQCIYRFVSAKQDTQCIPLFHNLVSVNTPHISYCY